MLKIGITGGIGSGKSTVAQVFEILSIPVYRSDDAAKRLMEEDEDLKRAITLAFGQESYRNHHLNREYLASEVFGDEGKIARLNALVHPAVIEDAARWFEKQIAPYVIKEAALIFESGAEKDLDYVIGVKAPEALRLLRAMERDHLSAGAVRARMDKQMDERAKMDRCDFIIINDELQPVIPQVMDLHEKFIKCALIPGHL